MTSPRNINPRLNGTDDDNDSELQLELVSPTGDNDIVPENDGTGLTLAQAYAYLAGDLRLADLVETPETEEPELEANPLLAAGRPAVVAENTGAMIALIPRQDDINRLALEGGEPEDELHLTLFYLGEADAFSLLQRAAVVDRITELVMSWGTIAATGFGAAVWNPESDTPALVLNVGGCDCLHDAHHAVKEELESLMLECPEQHTPYAPHVCLAYGDVDALIGTMRDALARTGEIIFDRVRIAFGTEVADVALVYSDTDTTVME